MSAQHRGTADSSLGIKAFSPRASLSRQVADQLEHKVLSGVIPVGEKLPTENALCEMFGVSRTVIREAVAKLKSMGLVETRRGHGTTVMRNAPADAPFTQMINPTTVEDILHLLELRIVVEQAAAEFAAERRDEQDLVAIERALSAFHQARVENRQARSEDYDFHLSIAVATKNPLIKNFFQQFNKNVIPRAQILNTDIDQEESDRYLARVAEEHTEIFDAIRAGDSKVAGQAMYRHLSRAYHLYESYLRN